MSTVTEAIDQVRQGASPRFELHEGLSADEALRRALDALRAGDVGRHVAAFFLADLADRETYLELSPDLKDFIKHRIRGYKEKTIRNLMSIGRGLRDLPDLVSAFAAGRLTWSQVRCLVPFLTPETQQAWIEWAAAHTPDELAAQLAGRQKGDPPTSPERRRIHTTKVLRGARLSPTRNRIWEQAREKLEAELGRAVNDEELMMEGAQMILRTRPDGSVPGRKQVNDTHYLVHAYPRAPGSQELVTADDNGAEVPLDRAELEARLEREPSIQANREEAILDPENHGPLVPLEERDIDTPEALRKEVLARDGYRCRCCSSKQNLTVHHRRWRSFGGKTARSNLVALCERCHSRVHDRFLIVLGDPEGALCFKDAKGRPLDRVAASHGAPVQLTVVAAAPGGAAATQAGPVDLDRMPAEIDASWWRRHEHLLSWNERQGELVLTPGFAVEGADRMPQTGSGGACDGPALDDLVGLSAARERLRVAIAAARERGEPLRHHLLAGPPGVGKTSLARAVAAELAAPFGALPAPHVRTPDTLVRALASLASGAALFMDEVHALPARAAEVLYEALDAGSLSLPVRQGLRTRTVRLRLRPFTLIGATTDPEQLPKALLSRLRVIHLAPYPVAELAAIVGAAARAYGLEVAPDAAERIARASRDTPRRALALLEVVRDEAAAAHGASIDVALVERALAREGVDAAGLDEVERAYLGELDRSPGPVGLSSLAARLEVGADALRAIHEPFLLRRGLIRITPLGRVRRPRAA